MTESLASLPAAFGKYCPKWENSVQSTVFTHSHTKFWWHPPCEGVNNACPAW